MKKWMQLVDVKYLYINSDYVGSCNNRSVGTFGAPCEQPLCSVSLASLLPDVPVMVRPTAPAAAATAMCAAAGQLAAASRNAV